MPYGYCTMVFFIHVTNALQCTTFVWWNVEGFTIGTWVVGISLHDPQNLLTQQTEALRGFTGTVATFAAALGQDEMMTASLLQQMAIAAVAAIARHQEGKKKWKKSDKKMACLGELRWSHVTRFPRKGCELRRDPLQNGLNSGFPGPGCRNA